MEIQHPEWLQLKVDNQILFGYDQEWYTSSFQRTRGCGPTVAAMLLSYLNRREGEPLPLHTHDVAAITRLLEQVWTYVTPNWLLGLNSTAKFCRGMNAFFRQSGVPWQCRRLGVSVLKSRRPSVPALVQFIEQGLKSDCPVAFLNLHKGKVQELESWHWLVIVALSYDRGRDCYMATGYDGGRSLVFDLGQWLDSSRLGGGFAYVTVDAK